MQYKAHINEETGAIQTVAEHALNTAKMCEDFSIPQMRDIASAIGLLHDVGKWQASFQRRINGENCKVEHSTCGAVVAGENYPKPLSLLMEYCIAGHHSGLPDGGMPNDTADMSTLQGRLKRTFEDYSAYADELKIPKINVAEFLAFLQQDCDRDVRRLIDKFAFLTRYALSCVADADSIDTMTFCGRAPKPMPEADFRACLDAIDAKLAGFVCETELQKSRALLQKQVFDKVDENAEIYLINMPTGSGKTLCSMKFALERVLRTGKKRIIYIAPYNGIIDQTAATFEALFGTKAEVLRHQSSFSYEDEVSVGEDYKDTVKKATENWQAPLIISTMVQFFESLYSNKRGKLRKLHNMADSIIIFDEAHLMPQKYLQPCLQAIAYITKYLGSEAVFLTATMPDFARLVREYALPSSKVLSLIDDTTRFKDFQKCAYERLDDIDADALLQRAGAYPSSLIIVNRKQTARELYRAATGEKYHLSTYMTPNDRANVIEDIRGAVRQLEKDYPNGENVPEDRRIIVISTSLIEAGIDLDMHSVFREINGLDSVLQSGGRCNREGKRENAKVFVFSFENASTKAYANERTNLTKGLLQKYEDVSDPVCISEYYDRLIFMNREEIEGQAISAMTAALESIPFGEYADKFEIIKSPNVSVVVAQDEQSREIVESLRYTGTGGARRLQKYVCSVTRDELNDLKNQHAVDDFGTGIWCLVNTDYYDSEIGITFEAKDYIL